MKKFKNCSFIRFFTKFPQLLLAGLLFSVPLALFMFLFVFISRVSGFNNVIIWGLAIIPSFPFLAGLAMVVRKYSADKKDVPVIKTFFRAVKENLGRFLIHGVVVYVIVACSFFSLLYYGSLSETDAVFGSVLMLYIIFTLLLAVMMYYVPVMTITYELKMKDIYKNSFLLIFGKILRNLIATLCIAPVICAAILLLTFSSNHGVWFWVSAAAVTVLLPMTVVYIIISVISKGMRDSVGDFVTDDSAFPQPEEQDEEKLVEEISAASSDSDYVFVNGRMIKRKEKSEKADGD